MVIYLMKSGWIMNMVDTWNGNMFINLNLTFWLIFFEHKNQENCCLNSISLEISNDMTVQLKSKIVSVQQQSGSFLIIDRLQLCRRGLPLSCHFVNSIDFSDSNHRHWITTNIVQVVFSGMVMVTPAYTGVTIA